MAKELFDTALPSIDQLSAVQDLLDDLGLTNQRFGNVVRVDLPSIAGQSRHSFAAYNDDGDVIYTIDAEGNKNEFSYYPLVMALNMDNPTLESLLHEIKTDVSYTVFTSGSGGIAVTVDPDYRNSSYQSDEFVNATTTFSYDLLGRVTSTTNPLGVTASYAYNDHGEVIEVRRASAVDPADLDETTGWLAYNYKQIIEYDANGSVIKISIEDRHCTTGDDDGFIDVSLNEYGGAGQLLTTAYELNGDSAGTSTSYYYTKSGELALTIYPAGNADFLEYEDGRIVRVTRGVHELTTTRFNELLNAPDAFKTTEHFDVRGGQPSTFHYFYNDKGQIVAIVDAEDHGAASGYGQADGDVVNLTYDDKGRVVFALDPLNNEARIIYNDDGQVTDLKLAGFISPSASTTTTMRHTHYDYDTIGRLHQVNRWAAIPTGVATSRTITIVDGSLDEKPAGTWIASRYEYDKLGRIKKVIDDNQNETLFYYDGHSRTVRVDGQHSNKVQYWYDDGNNLIETKRTDGATTTGTVLEIFRTSYFYDSLDRLITTVASV